MPFNLQCGESAELMLGNSMVGDKIPFSGAKASELALLALAKLASGRTSKKASDNTNSARARMMDFRNRADAANLQCAPLRALITDSYAKSANFRTDDGPLRGSHHRADVPLCKPARVHLAPAFVGLEAAETDGQRVYGLIGLATSSRKTGTFVADRRRKANWASSLSSGIGWRARLIFGT
jgi:hypothetical protein